MGSSRKSIKAVVGWVRRQPPKVKAFLGVVAGMAALVFLRFIVHDHDNLFVAAEACHAIGISILIYKLTKRRTCAGLSLKSQELTALFLAVRLYCSFVMEYDIHTLLDTATLATTLWVIYVFRFKLRTSYMEDQDSFAIYYLVILCAVLALLVHPSTTHIIINRIFWAFSVYLEAVSVLPQLCLMQNTEIVEPFTAHYVFALGVARFLSCAHWVLQICRARFTTSGESGQMRFFMILSIRPNRPDSHGESDRISQFAGESGAGYTRTTANSFGLWVVAFHGPSIRNCSDIYHRRLLLLLCEELSRWTACATPSFWSGLKTHERIGSPAC